MDPCPSDKRGRHDLASVLVAVGAAPDNVTLYCGMCGAVRRFSATGELLVSRLDDHSAESILRSAAGIVSHGATT